LVIEIDGGQHYSDEGKEKDKMRNGHMKSVQLKVLYHFSLLKNEFQKPKKLKESP